MGSKTRYTVRYRRRREGRTDFKKRLELLKGGKDRLVIRRTNTQLIMQIIRYNPTGDKVLLTTKSSELKKKGWKYSCKSLPAAYLAGLLLAKNAAAHNVKEAVLDLGLQSPWHGTRLFSALKGVVDGGIKIPVNEKAFPSNDRLSGKHIAAYLEKSKNITADFEKLKQELSR